MTPGALNGTKPKSYGTGRRCACGAKIMQYRKGDRCGLCEDDDERHARFVAQAGETAMGLWKSKGHPDGCRECPDGERLLRRHAGNGLCSLHRSRAKRNGTLDAKANEVADAARAITLDATSVDNGTKLDRHLAIGPDPRLDGRIERQTQKPPHPLDYPASDEGADEYRRAAAAYEASDNPGRNPEGCPKDADQTCCFNPDDCNPGWQDESRPEPGAVDRHEHTDDCITPTGPNSGLLNCSVPDDEDGAVDVHTADDGRIVGDDEPLLCCGAKDDPTDDCGGPGCEHADLFAERDAEAGCEAEDCCAYIPGVFIIDPEVIAMARLIEALEPLEREQRVRALNWCVQRYDLGK